MLYKKILSYIFFSLILVVFLIHNSKFTSAGDIKVSDSWAKESLITGRPGAVYLTIHNGTPSPITLIGAETVISEKVHIHESYKENSITKMRPIDKITIASGTHFKFQPGAYHFMLTSLKEPLSAKRTFPLILFFADTEGLPVTVHVTKHSRNSKKDHHEH